MLMGEKLTLRNYTAGLLARKWTLPIAQVLGHEVKRHSELGKCLPGITQKVLTQTLREMERAGLLVRTIYPTIPPQVEYQLTPIGFGLLKLSTTFSDWFDTHQHDMQEAQYAYDNQKMLGEIKNPA